MLCLGGGLGASFFGGAVDLAGVVDALAVGVEDLEGAVVDFLGAVVCLFGVEEVLVFFGGSLGIFFFCSGIIIMIMIMIMVILVQCVWFEALVKDS